MAQSKQEIKKLKLQMYHTGWRHRTTPNFGDRYESRDDIHTVEITRFGEWMLYRYDPVTNTARQLDSGECPAKLFLSILASGASYEGAR